VPLAGEEGIVAGGLQHRCQGPLRGREPAALALERDRRHAAAIRDSPGLHGGPPGRAARLGIEREERHALLGETVDVRRGHAPALAATVGAEIPVSGVVGDNHENVRLALLGQDGQAADEHENCPDGVTE
jgi:hypothetical protein